MKKLIKGGTIVTSADTYKADILVESGKIVAIANNLSDADAEVIYATGQYVLPGMIDEHTHVESPFGGTITAPWKTESVAAAVGGTTTIVDFALQTPGESLQAGVNTWKERAHGQSAIDYGFHIGVTDLHSETIREIPTLVEKGIPTLKLFMAYKGDLMIEDSTLYETLEAAKEVGALVMVHAENGSVIDLLQKKCLENGQTEPYYHAVSRPIEVETEATSRAIAIAEIVGAPLFIVHVSGEEPAERIREAKAKGLPIYAETCPHYLFLTTEELKKPNFEGAKYVCSPPLRDSKHHEALWNALQDGTLQAIGSDHCAFNFKGQKELGMGDFTKIPNGGNGIEHRLTLLYTYGVTKGRMTINQMVDLLATTPAKVMGLYPEKGTIAVGADADLVIFNPNERKTISHVTSYQGLDYDMFEGFDITGVVKDVFLRGKQIVKDSKYVGTLGDGNFQMRKPFGLCYKGVATVEKAKAEV
ncbi:dihydropyrimidinase [Halalkalibacter wakoensis JCM 9140]|uniref:Dihydropyrimidinase n=1 Tax=Halalkalibacter wakoensis JCM 9140 TaxID=1236970 RepID=W4Q0M2_9BACI|nr:dihydropyrimidinase [Halalkalibacter wakoensis]GAE25527.1 dihydropyrimidinase [Halalkalibacter wakoensis JCM 9140]